MLEQTMSPKPKEFLVNAVPIKDIFVKAFPVKGIPVKITAI